MHQGQAFEINVTEKKTPDVLFRCLCPKLSSPSPLEHFGIIITYHLITLWVMKWDGQFVVNADFNSTFRL